MMTHLCEYLFKKKNSLFQGITSFRSIFQIYAFWVPISAVEGPHWVPILLQIRSPLGPHDIFFRSSFNVGAVNMCFVVGILNQAMNHPLLLFPLGVSSPNHPLIDKTTLPCFNPLPPYPLRPNGMHTTLQNFLTTQHTSLLQKHSQRHNGPRVLAF